MRSGNDLEKKERGPQPEMNSRMRGLSVDGQVERQMSDQSASLLEREWS